MEIRSVTNAFSKGRCKLIHKRELEIKKSLDLIDAIICNSDDLQNTDRELKQYEDLKKDLQAAYERQGKAAMFRSKCRLLENGERPTKYFVNLEKTNCNKKTITELEIENDKVILTRK